MPKEIYISRSDRSTLRRPSEQADLSSDEAREIRNRQELVTAVYYSSPDMTERGYRITVKSTGQNYVIQIQDWEVPQDTPAFDQKLYEEVQRITGIPETTIIRY